MLVRETQCSDQLCKIPYNYVYGIVIIALFTDNNVAKNNIFKCYPRIQYQAVRFAQY